MRAFRQRSGCAMASPGCRASGCVPSSCGSLLRHGRAEVVGIMGESGFLEPILGGLGYTTRLSRLIAIEAERAPAGGALLRLVALGVVPEDADRLRDRLRLANAEADRLRSAAAALIGLHGIAAPPSFYGLRGPPVRRRTQGRARCARSSPCPIRSAPLGLRLRRRPVGFSPTRPSPSFPSAARTCSRGACGGAAGRPGAARLPGAVGPSRLP